MSWRGCKGTVTLDPVPGGVASGTCKQCGQGLTFARTIDAVRVRPDAIDDPPQQPITSELIEQVRTRLPKQPWPQGIHREIATEFEIPLSVVRRTIEELIRRGDFHPQENGVVQHRDKPEAEEPTAS